MNRLFTSESVGSGHPDKLCDKISDAVLDACLTQDPESRVACECYAIDSLIVVGGEITSHAYVDIPALTKRVLKEIGYTQPEFGLDYKSVTVLNAIRQQSPDIAMGVDRSGAGDQGIMFGYACNETEQHLPAPIMMAHDILRTIEAKKSSSSWNILLGPDAKSQVTLRYEKDNPLPVEIDTIVVSQQHHENVSLTTLKDFIIDTITKDILPKYYIENKNIKYHINPTGRFVLGGPAADTGLTGRKIIVDTYGGMGRHGGGAFSGKDPSKVDRSAAYMARHIAKSVVASNLATRCELQLSYAIGVAEPISIHIDTFGTNYVPENEILEEIRKTFDMTPAGIIKEFDLKKPIYEKTATFGHFTDNKYPWENVRLM